MVTSELPGRPAGEDDWRQLPPTPQELSASLRSDLQKLKHAILMAAENTVTRPWQKTMDFVDGLKGKLSDEELAVIKQYVEKRSREAAQAQVTVTPDDTVQHCSSCSTNPDMPSDVYFKLKSNEGKMAGNKSTKTMADITFLQQGHKPRSEENKHFDPGGKGKKAPPWNAAVTLLPFSEESWEAPCWCFVFSDCALSYALCVLCFLNYCSFQVITSQRAEKHEGRRGSSRRCTQPESKHFLVYQPLEDGEDKQHPVWS